VYRISYMPDTRFCTIRLFPADDATFDNDSLSDEARWQYYIASYTMTDATEGVDQAKMLPAYLRRNIAPQNANVEAAYQEVYATLAHIDDQTAFISPDSYKVLLKGVFEFVRPSIGEQVSSDAKALRKEMAETFKEKFLLNTTWMRDQSADDVELKKAAWASALKGNHYDHES